MLEYDNNYIRRLIQLNLVGVDFPRKKKGNWKIGLMNRKNTGYFFYKIKKQLSVNEIRNYLQTDVEDARKSRGKKTFGAPAVRPRRGTEVVEICRSGDTGFIITEFCGMPGRENGNKQATVACLSPVLTLITREKISVGSGRTSRNIGWTRR